MKKIIATIVALVFSASAYAVEISNLSIGASMNHGLYGADGKEEKLDHLGAIGKTTKRRSCICWYLCNTFFRVAVNDTVSVGLSYAPDAVSTPSNINDDEVEQMTLLLKLTLMILLHYIFWQNRQLVYMVK